MLLTATYVHIPINWINYSLLGGLETGFTIVFKPQAYAAEDKV